MYVKIRNIEDISNDPFFHRRGTEVFVTDRETLSALFDDELGNRYTMLEIRPDSVRIEIPVRGSTQVQRFDRILIDPNFIEYYIEDSTTHLDISDTFSI